MMVASGTSTPTSITVVAIRMRVSPALKAPSPRPCRALHLAMHEADVAEERAASLETLLRGRQRRASDSSTSGQIQ
jgi:hypothetical protein